MAIKYTRLIPLCFLILAAACGSRKDGQSYIAYLQQDEQLQRKVMAGGISYTFRIVTPEAMAWKDSYDPDTKVLDRAHYHTRLEQLKDQLFILIDQQVTDRNISVLKYKSSGNPEYEQRVMYYETQVGDDVRMLCNGKSYPPAAFQYENHLELSPINTLLVAFPRCREGDRLQITFNDRALGNLMLNASFDQKDIEDLPPLVVK